MMSFCQFSDCEKANYCFLGTLFIGMKSSVVFKDLMAQGKGLELMDKDKDL